MVSCCGRFRSAVGPARSELSADEAGMNCARQKHPERQDVRETEHFLWYRDLEHDGPGATGFASSSGAPRAVAAAIPGCAFARRYTPGAEGASKT